MTLEIDKILRHKKGGDLSFLHLGNDITDDCAINDVISSHLSNSSKRKRFLLQVLKSHTICSWLGFENKPYNQEESYERSINSFGCTTNLYRQGF
jgi:hypothetical protein